MLTWEAKWTHIGLKFPTGVKTSSVHMKFHFGCISKWPDLLMGMCKELHYGWCLLNILSPEVKFHFCQNNRYEIHTSIEFQRHMRIKRNIQRVCAYSFRVNYVHMKILCRFKMRFIPLWVSFHLNSCEHK